MRYKLQTRTKLNNHRSHINFGENSFIGMQRISHRQANLEGPNTFYSNKISWLRGRILKKWLTAVILPSSQLKMRYLKMNWRSKMKYTSFILVLFNTSHPLIHWPPPITQCLANMAAKTSLIMRMDAFLVSPFHVFYTTVQHLAVLLFSCVTADQGLWDKTS